MKIEEKHGMFYVHVDGAKYQIAEEPQGGLMVRLVDAPGRGEEMRLTASSSNTFRMRPNDD